MTRLPKSETLAGDSWKPSRAQRFDVSLPLLYRRPGDTNWYQGTADNISCSGVYFHGRQVLDADAPVEMALHIPYEISGGALIHIGCTGRVVRVAPQNGGDQRAMGAAVVDYRLFYPQHRIRSPHPDEHLTSAVRHGLNNLLEVMLGYSNLLLMREDLPEEARSQIEKIQKAARDAASVVQAQMRRKPSA